MTPAAVARLREERRNGPQGRLLRGYLHKTSNALCGIKGYASLIADDAAGDAARWAERIIREVERLEDIFRSVGDLTELVENRTEPADLAGLVAGAVAAVAATHPGPAWDVGELPKAELLMPAADLALVMRELLANAAEGRDGIRGAARVTVRAAVQPTGHVILLVADDGPGMDAPLAAQAAHPFVTTKDGRAGVGLARVETLLDMYGLAWHLRSVPGEGTNVTLEVARAAERIAAAS
ncbi:MAG TPA: HAMP domain-containing sensor histidine kinase [Candidatus Krumholzibacteria bacterium]|nr:HAMP domain-containing sensor histidine kinase [Candidatus Krumholzibacteria bacterium]